MSDGAMIFQVFSNGGAAHDELWMAIAPNGIRAEWRKTKEEAERDRAALNAAYQAGYHAGYDMRHPDSPVE